MSKLAQWCSRRRFVVLAAWIVLFVGLVGGVVAAGSGFTEVNELPHSESATAYSLLAERSSADPDAKTGTIVWHTTEAVDAPIQEAAATKMLDAVAQVPGVTSIRSPFAEGGGGQISTPQRTAYAVVTVTGDLDLDAVQAITDKADTSSFDVATGGRAFTVDPSAGGATEAIGVLVALVLLLFMFRSGWAAALPILTGIVGVGASLLVVILGSHVIDLPETAITMAALIGLAVGIDYALFIVNRHRKALMAGATVREGIAESLNTSGRAVIFGGLTVVIALIGMFIVELPVLTAMGQAAALTVVFTVITALTLLPALLAMIGTKVLSKRQRATLATGIAEPVRTKRGFAERWSDRTEKHPIPMAIGGLIVVAALALPVLSLRVGNADASSDPKGSPGLEYSQMMAPAFGNGIDAPLLLVAQTPDAASARAFSDLVAGLGTVDHIASVSGNPLTPGQTLGVATIIPTTSAQAEETADLVHELRSEVIPAAAGGTALKVFVAGETATNIDMSTALMNKLPIYLGSVAILGFLLLMVAFRSIVVPLIASLSNLLTIAAGLGVVTAVFQWGWGIDLLGVGAQAPIMYIVPIILVGVMYGLSMDYQVFLISRIHEEWTLTGDNDDAVRVGVRETSLVIAVAASIMLAVFASFGMSGQRIISTIGLGLAASVIVDAFLLRLTVMPALLRLAGRANWWYPKWADRITPHVAIEGPSAPVHATATAVVEPVDPDGTPVLSAVGPAAGDQ